MVAYFDGRYLSKDEIHISPDDRGFLFGDGSYEVVRIYGGEPFRLKAHLKRFEHSLREMGLNYPNLPMFEAVAKELIRKNGMENEDGFLYIKKVFVASGIRYDMVLADARYGKEYLKEIVANHVSGQLKVAPEHTEDHVLTKMGKPGRVDLIKFKALFDNLSAEAHKDQFLTYYLIAAHPGCSEADMHRLKQFASQELHISPEQVQIFTPSPSTYSSLMYYTGLDPFSRQPVFVEKDPARRQRQKEIVVETSHGAYHKAGPRSRSARPGGARQR